MAKGFDVETRRVEKKNENICRWRQNTMTERDGGERSRPALPYCKYIYSSDLLQMKEGNG